MSLFKKSRAHKRQHQGRPSQVEEDIICEGSDAEQTPEEVHAKCLRYEKQAQRCLNGKIPFLQSANLRGPLEREWINPWRYQHSEPTWKHRGEVGGKDIGFASSYEETALQETLTHLQSQSTPVEAKSRLMAPVGRKSKAITATEDEVEIQSANSKLKGGSASESEGRPALILSLPKFELDHTGVHRPSATLKMTDKPSRKSTTAAEATKRPADRQWLKNSNVSKRAKWDSPAGSSPTPVRTLQLQMVSQKVRKGSDRSARTAAIPTQSEITPTLSSSSGGAYWDHNTQHIDKTASSIENLEDVEVSVEMREPDESSTPDLPMRRVLSNIPRKPVHKVKSDRQVRHGASRFTETTTPAFCPGSRQNRSPTLESYSSSQVSGKNCDLDGNIESMPDVSFISEVAPSSRNLEKFQFRKKRKRSTRQVFRDSDDATLDENVIVSRSILPQVTASQVDEAALSERLTRGEDESNILLRTLPTSSTAAVHEDIPSIFHNNIINSNDVPRTLPLLPVLMLDVSLNAEHQGSPVEVLHSPFDSAKIDSLTAEATSQMLSHITPPLLGKAALPIFDFEGGEAADYMLFDALLGNNMSSSNVTVLETSNLVKQDGVQLPSNSISNIKPSTVLASDAGLGVATNSHLSNKQANSTAPTDSSGAGTSKVIDVSSHRASKHMTSSQEQQQLASRSSMSFRTTSHRCTSSPIQKRSPQNSPSSSKMLYTKSPSQKLEAETRYPITSETTTPTKTLIDLQQSKKQLCTRPEENSSTNTFNQVDNASSRLLFNSERRQNAASLRSCRESPSADESTQSFNTTPPISSSITPSQSLPFKAAAPGNLQGNQLLGSEESQVSSLEIQDGTTASSPEEAKPRVSLQPKSESLGSKESYKWQVHLTNHHSLLTNKHSSLLSSTPTSSSSHSAKHADPQEKKATEEDDISREMYVVEEHDGLKGSTQSEPSPLQSPWGPTDHLPIFYGPKFSTSISCTEQLQKVETAVVSVSEMKNLRQPLTPKFGIEFLKSLMAPTPQRETRITQLRGSPATRMAKEGHEITEQRHRLDHDTGEADSGWEPFAHPASTQYHGITPFSELMPTSPPADESATESEIDLCSTQLLMEAATNNPWSSAIKNTASKNPKKRVSWMPGPELASGPTAPMRRDSPPPEMSGENDVLDSNFESHFSAARRAKCSSTRITVLNSSSPPICATAEAFITADFDASEDMELQRTLDTNLLHNKLASRTQASTSLLPYAASTLDNSPCLPPVNTTPTSRTIDYMDEFFGENGGILEEWSVEAELKKASRATGTAERTDKWTAKRGGLKNRKHW